MKSQTLQIPRKNLGILALALFLSWPAFSLPNLSELTNNTRSSESIQKVEKLNASERQALWNAIRFGQDPERALLRAKLHRGLTCNAPIHLTGFNVNGTITVPEDYNQPLGRQIEVYYYGRITKGTEPVVFFNGGPGSDSHGSAQVINSHTAPEIKKLSWIYIDQRGTGCSSPFPDTPTMETVERLTHYTSEEIVKDSEAIREKLFGKSSQWKIFGQSYGGLIVHRYAMNSPQSILAAYAHGFSLMNNPSQWLELRILSQKRVIETYFKKYPQDRAKIDQIRAGIPSTQCFTDGDTKICGNAVIDALTIFLGFTNSWPTMNRTISGLLTPNGTVSQISLNTFVSNYVFGVYNGSGLAGSVISMTEVAASESDQIACQKVNQAILASGDDPNLWSINECRLLGSFSNTQWDQLLSQLHIQKQMTPGQLKSSLATNPVPFFLYAGMNDVFVPVETFKEEIAELGSLIQFQQFQNSGHEGFYTEPQVWSDLIKPRAQ